MLQLDNSSPCAANLSILTDQHCCEVLVLTLKASFELNPMPRLALVQDPVRVADEYWGEPESSSLHYAGEVHLPKGATDVVLVGFAQVPGRAVTVLDAHLAVGHLRKSVRVFGDRVLRVGLLGTTFSQPTPFERMPLLYERAYGGTVKDPAGANLTYPGNPVGVFYDGSRNAAQMDGLPLPNLEDPNQLITGVHTRVKPAGFGAIAPFWEPRRSFAGTYDDLWRRERAPFLPLDFDRRYFQLAHPDLSSSEPLRGGEPVNLSGLSPHGDLNFHLPALNFLIELHVQRRSLRLSYDLETISIEPEERRLSMVWRAFHAMRGNILEVRSVSVALTGFDVTPGGVNAMGAHA